MANQAEVAAHLDVSRQIVSKLCAQGVLSKAPGRQDYDLDACRIAYIRNLREQAAGRVGQGPAKLVLVDERARHAAAAADAQELKNAEMRRELLPRMMVTKAVHSAFSNVRSKLLGLPSRLAPLVVNLKSSSAVEAKLTEVIHEALAELASTRIDEPTEEEERAGDAGEDAGTANPGSAEGPEPDGGPGDAPVVRRVRTAAKADRKSVGRRKPRPK